MSEYTEIKRHFRIAKVQGTPIQAPLERLPQWERQFERVLEIQGVPSLPRLVNAFCIGADPEFVLEDVFNGVRIDADALGMKTGLAFGADMNGRLVELRPEPSRFALAVVASVLEELRWMAALVPRSKKYTWQAGAFVYKDGLGGHVHVGRKWHNKEIKQWARYFNALHARPAEDGEQRQLMHNPPAVPGTLGALDLVMEGLTQLAVFPEKEIYLRQHGDQHAQRYGLPSDIRVQAHGYEYRTFPSWLDSPWMAYLVLVLSKLVVFDPELLPKPARERQLRTDPLWYAAMIRNLLAYYKGQDDDARIAHCVLSKNGMPYFIGGDFKARWGLTDEYLKKLVPVTADVVPASIMASGEDLEEIFLNLTESQPLQRGPQVTWQADLPKGYATVLSRVNTTKGWKGLGELLWDVCDADSFKVTVVPEAGRAFAFSPRIIAKAPKDWRERIRKIVPEKVEVANMDVKIPAYYRTPQRAYLAKKVLLSGVLPLWSIKDVRADSLKDWLDRSIHQKKYSSIILFKGER